MKWQEHWIWKSKGILALSHLDWLSSVQTQGPVGFSGSYCKIKWIYLRPSKVSYVSNTHIVHESHTQEKPQSKGKKKKRELSLGWHFASVSEDRRAM